MKDLISRQAAIDALCSVCGVDCDKSEFVYDGKQEDQVILCPEHYVLTQLPSAQPEHTETHSCDYQRTVTHDWIPVTERVPDVRQWVLCQCRANIMDVLRLTDDGSWYRKSNEIYMSGFVLAWMPLPEPWKGEKHEL